MLGDAAHTACAVRQAVGIGFGENSLHPDIDRQGVDLAEAVEQSAGRNLVADPLYSFELLRRLFERERIDFRKIDGPVGDLSGRIDYIFISESRAKGRKFLNTRFNYPFGRGK